MDVSYAEAQDCVFVIYTIMFVLPKYVALSSRALIVAIYIELEFKYICDDCIFLY